MPQSHATHQVHKLPKTDDLERFPNFAMRSSSVQHLCDALSVFMSSGNSVARPLREEGDNPTHPLALPKRKQKVDVCFAKNLSPSRKSMQSKTAAIAFTPKIGFDFIVMQSATSHN